MGVVSFGEFGGENRKLSEFMLAHSEAVIAENLDFRSGKFTPFRGISEASVRGTASGIRDIAWFAGAVREIDFKAETAVAGVPRGGKHQQLFITGAGKSPRVMDEDGTTSRLGAPWHADWVPEVSGTPTVTGANVREFRFACTVVMADGSESPLSKVLRHGTQPAGIDARDGVIEMGENGAVDIDFNVTVGVSGNPPDVDDRNLQNEYKRGDNNAAAFAAAGINAYEEPAKVFLYRSIDSGEWHKVGEQSWDTRGNHNFGVQRYADAADSTLTAQFVGEETRPRLDLRGIGIHPKGFAFGFAGNFLCFSAREQYGVWPRSYEVEIPEGDIINAVEYGSSIFVFAENTPPIMVVLDSPESATIQRNESAFILRAAQARTVVNMGEMGVLYAVKQGIVQLPGGRLLTEAVLAENEDFIPPTFAFADADEYFAGRAGGTMLYLTRRGANPGFVQMGRLNFSGFGEIISAAQDDSGGIRVLAGGTSPKVGLWRSGAPLVGRWKSRKLKMLDKDDIAALWVYGGQAARHQLPFGQWQKPARAVEGGALPPKHFVSVLGAANILEVVSGDIKINIFCGIIGNQPSPPQGDSDKDRVYFEDGAIRVELPRHEGGQAEGGQAETSCDCLLHCPAGVGAVDWAQVEVISERNIDFVAIGGAFDDFVEMKEPIGVYPAKGYIG